MRTIEVVERRARLARRHRLAPGYRATDVGHAAESMVCLHGTDPSTVYLSAWARVDGMAVADLERALYVDRSLVKHLAMRRTLFVFPRAMLSVAQAGASNRVADGERRRLIRDVEKAGLQRNGERWLTKAGEQVLAALSDGREATSSELRDEIPALEGSITYGEGKSWGGQVPVGPRVLTTLSAAGRIVRASNDGGWTTSALAGPRRRPGSGRRSSRSRTLTVSRAWSSDGCARSAPVPSPTSSGGSDRRSRRSRNRSPSSTRSRSIWTARSATSCPTTWNPPPRSSRGPRCCRRWTRPRWGGSSATGTSAATRGELFDINGNAGPTAWWDGRIVGGWRQSDAGEVELQLLEDVGKTGRRALDDGATRLTEWLGGTRVVARFPSPLSKQLAATER